MSIRRSWSNQDTKRLIQLVDKYGRKWRVFASYFPHRRSSSIRAHYLSVTKNKTIWTDEEKHLLKKLTSEKTMDWDHITSMLPKHTTSQIKKYWQNTLQPTHQRGAWRQAELDQLKKLVDTHGTDDWGWIAKQIKTRSELQCRNKWFYEQNTHKKGSFTKEEDDALIEAVNKFGIDDFQKIKHEMASERTSAQLRSRYINVLDPTIDRSPWTKGEKEELKRLYEELKDIKLVRVQMNSQRSIRDLRNKLRNK
ncbi:hypothetical protein K501DRAFT_333682 [Backusella circina FSU 941]|nr:hypothetical protein K501DRAFT_333682 [Backusella circina FSU 941]